MLQDYHGQRILLLAPLSKVGSHYRELFESARLRARIEVSWSSSNRARLTGKVHDIEVVIDRPEVRLADEELSRSTATALNLGKDNMGVTVHGEIPVLLQPAFDVPPPATLISIPNRTCFRSTLRMEPVHAMASARWSAELSLIILDDTASRRGIAPPRHQGQPDHAGHPHLDASGDTLKTPIKDWPRRSREKSCRSKEYVWVPGRAGTGSHVNWEGVIATIESAAERNSILRRWACRFMQKKTCPRAKVSRLKPISLQFKLGGKNIAELGQMDLATLAKWFHP